MTVRLAAVISSALLAAALVPAAQAQGLNYEVVGDGIPKPLTAAPGNAARGKALLQKREAANCLKCHTINQKDLAGGDKGPKLDGIGADLTAAQLRLSVVDLSRVTKGTEMPTFHKSGGEAPKLSAQEVEDIVAFLGTLRR